LYVQGKSPGKGRNQLPIKTRKIEGKISFGARKQEGGKKKGEDRSRFKWRRKKRGPRKRGGKIVNLMLIPFLFRTFLLTTMGGGKKKKGGGEKESFCFCGPKKRKGGGVSRSLFFFLFFCRAK